MQQEEERLEYLRKLAESQRDHRTVHASLSLGTTMCGANGQASGGAQWRARMRDELVYCCPDCLKLWKALSDTERRLLDL